MAEQVRGLHMQQMPSLQQMPAPEVNGHVHLVASELTAKHARGLRAAAATEGVHMKRRDACR